MDWLPLALQVLLAVVTVVLVVGWKYIFFSSIPAKLPDRLPPIVPGGNFFRTISLFVSNELPFILLEYSRQLGSVFCLPLLNHRVAVIVADPTLARDILHDLGSTKTRAYQWMERLAGGDTFFSSNGLRARHVRKAVTPAFASHTVEQMTTLFQAHLDVWLEEVFQTKVANQEPFDVMWEMQHITTRFIVEAAFDFKMTNEQVDTVLKSFSIACREFASSSALNPFRKLLNRKAARETEEAQSHLQSFARHVLDSYRNKKDPIHGSVIELIALNPEYETEEQRARDLLVFLFGGYETTAITLAFALLELARHKEEQELLRHELQCASTFQDSWNVPALRNVIRETFRLHPAAAVASVRKVAKDFEAGPSVIPKGSSVCVSAFLIHRNADIFEDPDSFQPKRWNEPSDAQVAALMPFGCGPRNCIGRALANAEIQVLLARLCRDFEFSIVEEGDYGYMVTHKIVGARLLARKWPTVKRGDHIQLAANRHRAIRGRVNSQAGRDVPMV